MVSWVKCGICLWSRIYVLIVNVLQIAVVTLGSAKILGVWSIVGRENFIHLSKLLIIVIPLLKIV